MLTRHIATYTASQRWQENQQRAQRSVDFDNIRALTENAPPWTPSQTPASSLDYSNYVTMKENLQEKNEVTIEMVEPPTIPSAQYQQQKRLPKDSSNEKTHIKLTIKQKIFQTLEQPNSSQIAFTVNLFILVILVLSIVTFLVSSMGKYWNHSPRILRDLDIACGSVFLVEYSTKLFTAPSWKAWIRAPESIIDFLAILPLFIELFVSFSGATAALRLVRLLRLFRILKLAKFSNTISIVGKTIMKAKDALFLLVFLVTISLLVFSSLMFYAEQADQTFDEDRQKWIRPDGTDSPFQSIPETFWWSVVTLTTTGYGDQYPITWPGRVIATLTMLSGIFAIAFPVTIVNTHFYQTWEEYRLRKEMKESESIKKGQEEWTTVETMQLLRERNQYMLEHLSSMEKQLQWYQFEIQQMGIILESLYSKFQKPLETPENKEPAV